MTLEYLILKPDGWHVSGSVRLTNAGVLKTRNIPPMLDEEIREAVAKATNPATFLRTLPEQVSSSYARFRVVE